MTPGPSEEDYKFYLDQEAEYNEYLIKQKEAERLEADKILTKALYDLKEIYREDPIEYEIYKDDISNLETHEEYVEYAYSLSEKVKLLNQEHADKKQIKEATAEQLEKIQESAETAERLNLIKHEFLNLFNLHSFNNPLIAEAFYYIIAGLLFKDKLRSEQLPYAYISTTIIQQSGTGKGAATKFLIELLEALNEQIREYNIQQPQNQLSEYTYWRLGVKSDTPETFLDRYPITKGEYDLEEETVQGLLSKYDLLLSEECSFLFQNTESGAAAKRELLLSALEGTPLEKNIVAWNDQPVRTIPKCCFVGSTRPIKNMEEHIAVSGAQQRQLNCFRRVTRKEREEMLVQDSVAKLRTTEEINAIRKRTSEFASKLLQIRLWINKTDLVVDATQYQQILELESHRLIGFLRDIENTVDEEHKQEILESFLGRFTELVKKMAFHNAATRKSEKIQLVDYENAFSSLEYSFDTIKEWIGETIEENKSHKFKDLLYRRTLKKIFLLFDVERKGVPRTELIKWMSKEIRKTEPTIRKIIGKYSMGQFAILKIEEAPGKAADVVYYIGE